MEALRKAIDIVGGQSELGKACGVWQTAVSNWLKRENVPAEYCPAIEKATKGEVRCEQLRPDVDWRYLRGTKRAKTVVCHD
jgi:DNA-binding transcriptional regulator YdaS (Cro superfamily)